LQQWNSYIQITAESGLRTRELTQNLISWGMTIQSLVYAGVIVVGAPMVIEGTLTTGSVVAASMLASRMIAPMATLCGVLARWQQVKAAKEGLDSIMQLPTENQREETPIRQDVLRGHYLFEQAQFRYHRKIRAWRCASTGWRSTPRKWRSSAATGGEIDVASGHGGRYGSGERRAAAGQPQPAASGRGGLRRNVGFMTQNARVLRHPAREHHPGLPRATDEEIFRRAGDVRRGKLCAEAAKGAGLPDHGKRRGLSGGQRQSILLARMLLRDPNIVLMDEPTASLDEHTEREFIQRLGDMAGQPHAGCRHPPRAGAGTGGARRWC
jgi:ATP-binding cassette subfamily C protein LapB